MTGQELEQAVTALGMSLTEVADEVNRLAGTKLTVADLSRMKRGEAQGGRDPSPVVTLFLNMRLEQRRARELDVGASLMEALEKSDLRIVRARPAPDFMFKTKE